MEGNKINSFIDPIYSLKSIKEMASAFSGIVIVDEAYIDFSSSMSAISLLNERISPLRTSGSIRA